MSQSLADRVGAHGGLSPTEERLARVLIEDHAFCAFASAGEIAARVQAHASALVRLAHKLGYQGVPELRTEIRGELLRRTRTDELVRRRLDDTGGGSVLDRLVEREIAALAELPTHLGQDALDRAAARLLAAPRVFVLAEGTAEALARHATRRLRRAGLMTVQLQPDPRSVAEAGALLRAPDAVLCFALREVPASVQSLCAQARAQQAAGMLIADLAGVLMHPAPDHLLAAPRGSELESGTLTVPMAILNALILTVAAQGAPATFDNYRTYAELRDAARGSGRTAR